MSECFALGINSQGAATATVEHAGDNKVQGLEVGHLVTRHPLWPERLEIMDSMPMTPTRKIIKGELAKRITPNGGSHG